MPICTKYEGEIVVISFDRPKESPEYGIQEAIEWDHKREKESAMY